MSLLSLPDEIIKNVMQYAGLRSMCMLAATCHTIRNIVNTEAIQQGVSSDGLTQKHVFYYPDDDDVIKMARQFDSAWCHIVNTRKADEKINIADTTIKKIDEKFCRWRLKLLRYTFVFKTCTYKWEGSFPPNPFPGNTVDVMFEEFDSGVVCQLPLRKNAMYVCACAQLLEVLRDLVEHKLWTLDFRQRTRLRTLLEDDLSISRHDTILPEYFF